MSSLTMSANDLAKEKERIERIRSTAETSDTLPKPEDYTIIHGKYRVVRKSSSQRNSKTYFHLAAFIPATSPT